MLFKNYLIEIICKFNIDFIKYNILHKFKIKTIVLNIIHCLKIQLMGKRVFVRLGFSPIISE